MKTTAIAIILALTAGSAGAAGFNLGDTNINKQGQAQGQSQRTSVNVEAPSLSYGAFLNIQSMANDRCGRVALGLVPYSAHTCNIIMEAETIFMLAEPAVGHKRAAQAALVHIGSNDTTMRKTLIRMGILRIK